MTPTRFLPLLVAVFGDPSAALFAQLPLRNTLLVDAHVGGSLEPRGLRRFGATCWFSGVDAQAGREPWVTDGTAAGTVLLGDLELGPAGSDPWPLGATSAGFVFQASTPSAGTLALGVFVTDGTAGATRRLAGFDPIPPGAVLPVISFADRVWFTAERGGIGTLWVTDGTRVERAPGFPDFDPRAGLPQLDLSAAGVVGARIVATWWTAATGWEPWSFDGSFASGVALGDFAPGSRSAGFQALGRHRGGLLFVAESPPLGTQLFWTDGTPTGTTRFSVPTASGEILDVREAVSLGSDVVFDGERTGVGRELWLGDGRSSRLLADLVVGSGSSNPRSLTRAGDRVFFWTLDGGSGALDLWSTDGSMVGTRLLPGPPTPRFGLLPGAIRPLGSGTLVVVESTDPIDRAPAELWLSDGSAFGTVQLTDVRPGGVARARVGARLGTRFLFSAADPVAGSELHSFGLRDVGAFAVEPYGPGCGADVEVISGAPRLGATFGLTAISEPASVGGVLVGSGADSLRFGVGCAWGVGGTPFGLGPLQTDPTGRAALSIPVPADAALLGARIDLQVFVAVPGGPLLGALAATPAVEVIVGR